ncbi:hypothetical protein PTSG_08019 [Salpingoeca rosetta]|uniref:Uncharacterized protein n=1 Tax=Salpingoeca rosetta (strain ATCC 50818 / BSB-021) TaxID=946362 RepID=F2UHS0_SALR5|nr:uncharacterized protein PTSG_08019 [Salpingoeca rosetta]EGD76669.1 hypothetical protein PTSG_08019 [Salpingoeca rosetta]|eukprot:XP_004991041.1 hypothetical protein PTSG_08019 [Salpingoeca rosetta]
MSSAFECRNARPVAPSPPSSPKARKKKQTTSKAVFSPSPVHWSTSTTTTATAARGSSNSYNKKKQGHNGSSANSKPAPAGLIVVKRKKRSTSTQQQTTTSAPSPEQVHSPPSPLSRPIPKPSSTYTTSAQHHQQFQQQCHLTTATASTTAAASTARVVSPTETSAFVSLETMRNAGIRHPTQHHHNTTATAMSRRDNATTKHQQQHSPGKPHHEDDMDDWVEAELRQVTDRMTSDVANPSKTTATAASTAGKADVSTTGNGDDSDEEFSDASDVLRLDATTTTTTMAEATTTPTGKTTTTATATTTAAVTSLLQTPTSGTTNVWAARANKRAAEQQQQQQQQQQNGSPRGSGANSPYEDPSNERIQQLLEQRRHGASPAMTQREHLLTSPFAHLTKEERMERVVKQVHFYFGDRNYPTDKFLRKQAKKSANGWVPLSVVCTYKKMKKITDDVPLMAEALKHSDVVEVNDEGTAIRRRNPPPKFHPEAICAATVVVTFVNPRKVDHARAQEIITAALNPFGRIVQIRKVDTYEDVPDEVTHFYTKMLNSAIPANLLNTSRGPRYLVEYDYADEALDAATEQDGRASVFHRTLGNLHIALLYKRRKQRGGDASGSNRSSAVQTPMSASTSRAHTPVMFQQMPRQGHQHHQPQGSRPQRGWEALAAAGGANTTTTTTTTTPGTATARRSKGGSPGRSSSVGRARASSLDNKTARAMQQQYLSHVDSTVPTPPSQSRGGRQMSRTPDPAQMRRHRAHTVDSATGRRNAMQKRSPLGKSITNLNESGGSGGSGSNSWRSGDHTAALLGTPPSMGGTTQTGGSGRSSPGSSPLKFSHSPLAKAGSADKLVAAHSAPRAAESPSWRSRSQSASPLPSVGWRATTSSPRPVPVSGRTTPAMGAIKRLPLGPDGSRGFKLKRTLVNY